MTAIYAGAKPHLEAAKANTEHLLEYATKYKVGPTWFRTQLTLLGQQIEAAERKTK